MGYSWPQKVFTDGDVGANGTGYEEEKKGVNEVGVVSEGSIRHAEGEVRRLA